MLSLGGLEPCTMPLEQMKRTCVFAWFVPKKTKTVHRKQLPLTAAYAFTDIRAQGKTLECVVVDIEKVPTDNITSFQFICNPLSQLRKVGDTTVARLRRRTIRYSAVLETRGGGRETGEIGPRLESMGVEAGEANKEERGVSDSGEQDGSSSCLSNSRNRHPRKANTS